MFAVTRPAVLVYLTLFGLLSCAGAASDPATTFVLACDSLSRGENQEALTALGSITDDVLLGDHARVLAGIAEQRAGSKGSWFEALLAVLSSGAPFPTAPYLPERGAPSELGDPRLIAMMSRSERSLGIARTVASDPANATLSELLAVVAVVGVASSGKGDPALDAAVSEILVRYPASPALVYWKIGLNDGHDQQPQWTQLASDMTAVSAASAFGAARSEFASHGVEDPEVRAFDLVASAWTVFLGAPASVLLGSADKKGSRDIASREMLMDLSGRLVEETGTTARIRGYELRSALLREAGAVGASEVQLEHLREVAGWSAEGLYAIVALSWPVPPMQADLARLLATDEIATLSRVASARRSGSKGRPGL